MTVCIQIVDDDLVEGDESFTVELIPLLSFGASMDPVTLTVIIRDNEEVSYEFDRPTYITRESDDGDNGGYFSVKILRLGDLTRQTSVRPTYHLEKNTYTVQESNGQVTVAVNRDGDTSQAGSVVLYTSDVEAESPSDYAASSFEISFQPGESTQSRTIPITTDNILEPSQSFEVTLRDPVNGDLSSPVASTVVINDDDVTVSLLNNNLLASEDGGSVRITFVRQGYLGGQSTVYVRTKDATASSIQPNADFEAIDTTVQFDSRESTKYLDIKIHSDRVPENWEYFHLEIVGTDATTIAEPSTAIVTISDSVSTKRISGSFNLVEVDGEPAIFQSDLGNDISQAYLDLEEDVLATLKPVLTQLAGFVDVQIVAFLPGKSIIVEFVVECSSSSPVRFVDVVRVVASNTDNNGYLGGSTLRLYYTAEEGLSDAGKAGIAIASVVTFLTIIILSAMICFRMLRPRSGKTLNVSNLSPDYQTNPPIVYDGANIQTGLPYSQQNHLLF
ncbi:extracellular matrix organizing protein FRAS1-like [Amphiura filiformis]|uniref:extracellular matrix organizing protein FRAS1-like n=1 Tax=Amphiura filiformis TaxID=82378 RepID=UPI003B2120BF